MAYGKQPDLAKWLQRQMQSQKMSIPELAERFADQRCGRSQDYLVGLWGGDMEALPEDLAALESVFKKPSGFLSHVGNPYEEARWPVLLQLWPIYQSRLQPYVDSDTAWDHVRKNATREPFGTSPRDQVRWILEGLLPASGHNAVHDCGCGELIGPSTTVCPKCGDRYDASN